jgi:uncharacterized protein (DUF433 family)
MSTAVRILKTPDVLHGKPRIEGTRVGIFQVGELVRRHGWSLDEVAHEFDLDIEEVEAALNYYDEHPELVDTLRAQHEAGCRQIERQSRADN